MNKFRRRSVLDVLVEASGEGLREAYVVNCAGGMAEDVYVEVGSFIELH